LEGEIDTYFLEKKLTRRQFIKWSGLIGAGFFVSSLPLWGSALGKDVSSGKNAVRFLVNFRGNDRDGMKFPYGLALDEADNLYVADSGNYRIQVFNRYQEPILIFGEAGSSPGKLNYPRSLAVNKGKIHILETNNYRFSVFNKKGEFLYCRGSLGKLDGKEPNFFSPTGIALDPVGNIYICDTRNHRVQVLTPDGNLESVFGKLGSGDEDLNLPSGIASNNPLRIFVSDSNNHCIKIFNFNGRLLDKWGKKGSGDGELNFPMGLWLDSREWLWVADSRNHRISVFDSSGKFITKFGSLGKGNGEMNTPTSVVVDRIDQIFVADSQNSRIAVFQLE